MEHASPMSRGAAKHLEERGFSFLPTRAQFFWLLFGYFMLHAVSRGWISETLGLDDAEQALVAQRWSWGYGPQPPLYTWLVMGLSNLIGWSSFTMALLKNLLLFALYLLMYFNARHLTRSHAAAVAAAVALEMMPSIAWEAHRELTHSILASMMVMATLLVFFHLKRERWERYLLLGLCAGLGAISKYNFAVFFAGLLLAGLAAREWRPFILNRWMALTLLTATAVVLPNLLWMSRHRDLAFASVYKFGIDPTRSWSAIPKGVKNWGMDCVDQVALIAVIFAALFWKPIRQKAASFGANEKLLCLMFLWIGALIFIGIAAFSVTDCRNRWLQPILIPTPLLLVALLRQHLTAARLKAILAIGGLAALTVAIAAPGRMLLTERLHKYEILNAPFRPLAACLREPLANCSSIYAEDRWLAGNLRVWFPDKAITIPEMVTLYAPATNSVVVWDASRNPRAAIVRYAQRDLHQTYTGDTFCDATYKFHHTNMMRLGLLFPAQ